MIIKMSRICQITFIYIGALMYRPVVTQRNYIGFNSTWLDAYKQCNGKGYLPNFSTAEPIIGLEEYWIGEFSALSPWIWMKGCYNRSSLTNEGQDPAGLLSAGTCVFRCSKSSYVALSDTLCYCISDEEYSNMVSKNTKISTKNCKKCANSNSTCGNGPSVFVYRRYDGTPPLSNMSVHGKGDHHCVSIHIRELKVTWDITNCSERHLTVCREFFNGREVLRIPVAPGTTELQSWNDAIKECNASQRNGYLADIDNEAEFNYSTTLGVWTSLFREVVEQLTLKDFDSSLTLTGCAFLALDQSSNNEIKHHYSSCDDTKDFICVLSDDYGTSGQTTSGSELASTVNIIETTEMNDGIWNSSTVIIGGSLGGLLAILLLVMGVVLLHRHRSKRKMKITKHTNSVNEQRQNEEYSYVETDPGSTQILVWARSRSDPGAVEYYEAYKESNNTHSHVQTSHQAVPENQTSNVDGVYLDTADGDYDVLGRKREHRSNQNIGHLYGGIQDDGVYDVTRNDGNKPTTDHFKDLYDTTRDPHNENTYDSTLNVDSQVKIISDNVYFNSKQVT